MSWIDLFFPKTCLGCGKDGGYVCSPCLSSVGSPKPVCPECGHPSIDGMAHAKCRKKYGIDGLISLWFYGGVIRKAIIALKYKFSLEIARELAGYATAELKQRRLLLVKNLVLTPIPIHRLRGNWRGFNQAEETGKLIAQKMGWGFLPDFLVRRKMGRSQTELKGKERLKNIKGVFSLSSNISVSQYPNILLFDDVLTTGATLKEAAKVLKRGGAKIVWGLTIAR